MGNCGFNGQVDTQEKQEQALTFIELGYRPVRYIDGFGWVGVHRFIYTAGLCCKLSTEPKELGYQFRYCYDHFNDCVDDAFNWNGEGDPSGNWIKRKGLGEKRNPNYKEYD